MINGKARDDVTTIPYRKAHLHENKASNANAPQIAKKRAVKNMDL